MAKQTINVGTTANDKKGDSLRSAFQKVNANFTELYVALGLDSGGLNLGAFQFSGSTLSTTDSSSITIAQAVTINSNLNVGGDLLPVSPLGGNIGSAANPWHSLYVSGSTIYIGGNALSINDQGELTYNDNRVAHEAGEFMTLDNLSDLNVNSPNAGDTIAWSGSQYVNVPLTQDRLADDGDEVVLVGGANPYVTFPAVTGGDQLVIQGGEVTASSGNLALTGQSTVTVISNAAGAGGVGAQYFQFAADGTLMFPDGSLALTDSVLNNGLDADIKGSVFGDDSSVMVNAIDRTLHSVSVNTLQLNFNISGDNIVAPTGGYITIGHGDGAGGVVNVATFDAGGIRFDQNVVMGNASEIRHDTTNNWLDLNLAGGNVGLASQTGVVGIYADYAGGPYTWLFKDNGSIQFPDMSLQTTAYPGPQTTLDGDVTGSVFADDSTIMVDGVNGVLRANVNVANTWTVTTGDKTWSFIYGDVSLGTNPIFEFPGSLQAVGSQTGIYAPADDLSGNWGMSIDAANSPYNVDIGEISGSNYWRFSGDGSITFPDASVQTTAWTGVADIARNIENEGDVSITVNLTDSTKRIWQFGEDGDFTIPGNLIYGGDTIHAKESTSTAGNPLTVRAGDSETQVGGNLILRGGDTIGNVGTPRNSGYAVLRAGSTVTGNGGYAELLGGNTTLGTGGQAYVTAGSATTGNGGPVEIRAGTTVTGDGGSVIIESGEAVTGTAGNIDITAKGTVTGDGGNVNLTGGSATSGNGGAINLTAGDTVGSGDPGTIRLRTFNAAAPQDWTFNFNGTLTFPDTTVQTTAFTTSPTLNVLKIDDGVHEKFQTKSDATGTVTHDCSLGHIFYHTSPDANWTANFTNLNLSAGYATTVTLVIVQGGTGYYPNAVEIGGSAQTINWQGNTTPTVSTNRTDVVTFSILNNSGTYVVLGQITGF